MEPRTGAKIITFYSYKGGTGRSMAVANVAWLLASQGHRVLTIDWDLEAPGLHRYFEPFLTDKTLENSTGLIDFVLEFASAAVSRQASEQPSEWYLEYANILAHATPVVWDFPEPGLLHFVPAGRQDSAYPVRVNSFDWRQVYERLGGGVWLEAVRDRLRGGYDYVLIDSRTGVSDTSGVCTVQMPDELVVCFTLNQQSIRGASAVAASALRQRKTREGPPTLKVWPLPTRVESSERDRLEIARAVARTRFSSVLGHLDPADHDRYWGEVEVAYFPLYAYEEVLAVFGDRPRQSKSLLASMEKLTAHLTGEDRAFRPMPEDRRVEGFRRFTARRATEYIEELLMIGEEYEQVRARMGAGHERTYLMTDLAERAKLLAGSEGAADAAEQLFKRNTDGARVVGLALAGQEPRRTQIDMALEGIGSRRSPFEQYHALRLAEKLTALLDPTAKRKLRDILQAQMSGSNAGIERSDSSRFSIAEKLLGLLGREGLESMWTSDGPAVTVQIGESSFCFAEIRPASSHVTYTDPDERHGPWVATRLTHSLELPRAYRLSQCLVTNRNYLAFVRDGGYEREAFWPRGMLNVRRFLTADGKSRGPAGWPSAEWSPDGQEMHPVSGICFVEARAFVHWLNERVPAAEWRWTLPAEDMWEYAARTEAGLIYPWGDAFEADNCNSRESGHDGTTDVERYPSGATRDGCRDMAGNVWEFVLASGSEPNLCVLRGGSYRNDRLEVRNYLRLFGVPVLHRPPDFGFRVAQVMH